MSPYYSDFRISETINCCQFICFRKYIRPHLSWLKPVCQEGLLTRDQEGRPVLTFTLFSESLLHKSKSNTCVINYPSMFLLVWSQSNMSAIHRQSHEALGLSQQTNERLWRLWSEKHFAYLFMYILLGQRPKYFFSFG